MMQEVQYQEHSDDLPRSKPEDEDDFGLFVLGNHEDWQRYLVDMNELQDRAQWSLRHEHVLVGSRHGNSASELDSTLQRGHVASQTIDTRSAGVAFKSSHPFIEEDLDSVEGSLVSKLWTMQDQPQMSREIEFLSYAKPTYPGETIKSRQRFENRDMQTVPTSSRKPPGRLYEVTDMRTSDGKLILRTWDGNHMLPLASSVYKLESKFKPALFVHTGILDVDGREVYICPTLPKHVSRVLNFKPTRKKNNALIHPKKFRRC